MKPIRFNKCGQLLLGSIAALCLLAAVQSRAEDKENRGQFNSRDYRFVTEVTQAGTKEVNLGQVAADKAVNQQVRDFGKRMVDDHSKANDELSHLVAQKGATPPDVSTKNEERAMEHLRSLNGPEFDKAFMKGMISDHKKVVKLFEEEANTAEDPDLKAWVNKTLPTLQDHLRMAQSVNDGLSMNKPQANAAQ